MVSADAARERAFCVIVALAVGFSMGSRVPPQVGCGNAPDPHGQVDLS